jgi:hypothetical protein
MGRKNIACLMRRSRPPGSGCSAKAALASLLSLRCCSLAWRRRRSLRARSQCQAILDQQPCSRRDHRASPSIRGRTSTDAARGGTSCSIVRRRFQALRGHGSIAARASGICTLICRRSRFATVFEQWQMRRRSSDGSCMRRKGELSAAAIDRGWRTRSCFRRVLRARGLQ